MTAHTFGIVGAGGMGKAIVRRVTTAGNTVVVTDNDLELATAAAADAGAGQPGEARAVSVEKAIGADVVVLAVWYPTTIEFARSNAAALAGKIVVDIANPLDETFTGLALDPTTSAAEELARAIPQSRIVKAFNTVPATPLLDGELDSARLDTFIASDDAAAKAMLIDALAGSGLRALDAGALANSRLLERLTAFGIELGQRYELGQLFGFKYLPTHDVSRSP